MSLGIPIVAVKEACGNRLLSSFTIVWNLQSVIANRTALDMDLIRSKNWDQWTLTISPFTLDIGASYNFSANASIAGTNDTWTIFVVVHVVPSNLVPRIVGCGREVNPNDTNITVSGRWSSDPDAANSTASSTLNPELLSVNLTFKWSAKEYDADGAATGRSFAFPDTPEIVFPNSLVEGSSSITLTMIVEDVRKIILDSCLMAYPSL